MGGGEGGFMHPYLRFPFWCSEKNYMEKKALNLLYSRWINSYWNFPLYRAHFLFKIPQKSWLEGGIHPSTPPVHRRVEIFKRSFFCFPFGIFLRITCQLLFTFRTETEPGRTYICIGSGFIVDGQHFVFNSIDLPNVFAISYIYGFISYLLTRRNHEAPCGIRERWFLRPCHVELERNTCNPYCLGSCLDILDLQECCLQQNHNLLSLKNQI